MDEYYRLNTPTPVDVTQIVEDNPTANGEVIEAAEPVSPSQAAKLKGSLASTFAKK